MSETLLSIKNLTMKFGGVTALNDVSIDVKKGEIAWKYTLGHDKALSLEEYDRLDDAGKKQIEKVAYLSATSRQYIFPPENDPALYTNHSQKDHNLSVVIDKGISSEPYFVANRDIKAGEEFTNNYHEFDTAIATLEKKPDWLKQFQFLLTELKQRKSTPWFHAVLGI